MESHELNNRLAKIADDESKDVPGLRGSGKAIPYIGWYWRDVDFDKPITLGDCGDFVGFMENNKWGYPEWTLSAYEGAALKALLIMVAHDPNENNLLVLYNYIQDLCPAWVKQMREKGATWTT